MPPIATPEAPKQLGKARLPLRTCWQLHPGMCKTEAGPDFKAAKKMGQDLYAAIDGLVDGRGKGPNTFQHFRADPR